MKKNAEKVIKKRKFKASYSDSLYFSFLSIFSFEFCLFLSLFSLLDLQIMLVSSHLICPVQVIHLTLPNLREPVPFTIVLRLWCLLMTERLSTKTIAPYFLHPPP